MPLLVLTLALLLGTAASLPTAATTAPVPRLRTLVTDSPLYRNATRQNPPAADTTTTTTDTPGDNSTPPSRPKGPLPSQGFNKPRPKATSMVHLTQVNSSSWASPENETFYTTEYWAANVADADLCEVKLAIALAPGVNVEHVKVNSSFALAFEGGEDSGSTTGGEAASSSSSSSSMAKAAVQAALTFIMDTAAHELTATLHPPYTQELRVRESVDLGFVLRGPDAALAQTGAARVVSARYCDGGIEEGESGGGQPQPEEAVAPNNAGGNGGSSSSSSSHQPVVAPPSRPKYQPGGY